jgi:hypothetical protein
VESKIYGSREIQRQIARRFKTNDGESKEKYDRQIDQIANFEVPN